MRLGGPIFEKCKEPCDWVAAHQRLQYTAAYCPLADAHDPDLVAAYARAATAGGIVIAEVGAWSSPLSPNETERKKAIALNQQRLALADAIGARCCVNVSGSRGANWAGPDEKNFTPETFDLIVQTVRAIVDAVKPTRAFYTLESMPCMYPDSADCYLSLIKAIDRKQFAAHLDPTNLICSPQRYYSNGAIIKDCFQKLGPYIRSCHAKDVALSQQAIAHLDEVRPGLGGLDYQTFLRELDKLHPDTPLMIEHLKTADEYAQAANHLRAVARKVGVSFR